MGLDQYLYAEKFASERGIFDEDGGESREFAEVKRAAGMSQVGGVVGTSHATVSMLVAYWRKANSIHGWFVRNCADGVDDCRRIHLERDRLVELKTLCERALASRDATEIPPTPGFFFGTYEVGEAYWDDIRSTIRQLNAVLEWFPEDAPRVSFAYQASW
jgi:hypothetical protein